MASDYETTTAPTEAPAEVVATEKHRRIYFSRLTMRAPLVVSGNTRPDIESSLSVGIYRENPFFEVRTNDPGDQDNNWGKVAARMDPVTFEAVLDAIVELADGKATGPFPFKNYNLYKGDQKFDEPQHINTTLVGRDDQGRIFIKIIEEGRPAPVFFFGPPKFHVLVNADKSEVPAGEASARWARAYAKMTHAIICASIGKRDDGVTDGMDKPQGGNRQGGNFQRNNGGGNFNRNGGGGYNRSGQQGGGWQNRNGGGGGYNRGGGGYNRGGQGGGGWQNRNGGGYNRGDGNNGWQNRGGQQGGGSRPGGDASSLSDDDITF